MILPMDAHPFNSNKQHLFSNYRDWCDVYFWCDELRDIFVLKQS